MKNRMRIFKEIAHFTSTEDFYKKAELLGEKAAPIFRDEKGKNQLNNLQNIANSSLKVTDTIDFIKRQIGGKRGFEQENFGNELIQYLYNELSKKRDHIKSRLKDVTIDEYDLQEIHLLLCRQFINSLVIHYKYCLEKEYN